MNKKEKFSPPAIGGSSLLVIFSVLCLTVFALLSLSTVLADRRISTASVEAVAAYYEADTRAEEIFARLRNGERPDMVEQTGNRFSYQCPISETQTLFVELEYNGEHWTVLRWQAAAGAGKEESGLTVWGG